MIPHNKPTLSVEEENAAVRVLRSGWIAQGIETEFFENEFCDFLGLPQGHAVAVSSGTSALFLALWILRAKGKIISFPVYACSSLRHAVAMAGGIERLIDVKDGSPNIDEKKLIHSGAEIAIVPHMFGLPVDINSIKGYGIEIIEDCAQALGSSIGGIKTGLYGKVGIFSFYATKLITTGGQGGMVVSRDKGLVDAVRDYREFDCRQDNKVRFNFKLTDIQAAIGREQLCKLPGFLKKRAEIFDMYKESGLSMLDIDSGNNELIPVRYRAVISISTGDRDHVIESLASEGIKAIIPIEKWELLGEPYQFPSASKLTQETVSLPIYPSLTDSDIDKILKGISYL